MIRRKRGQIALFIIVAVVILAIILLLFLVRKPCCYQGYTLPVLCFNDERGKNCEPLTPSPTISQQDLEKINDSIKACFAQIEEKLKEKGFQVSHCKEANWSIGIEADTLFLQVHCWFRAKKAKLYYSFSDFNTEVKLDFSTLWPSDLSAYANQIQAVVEKESMTDITSQDEMPSQASQDIILLERKPMQIKINATGIYSAPNEGSYGFMVSFFQVGSDFIFVTMEKKEK